MVYDSNDYHDEWTQAKNAEPSKAKKLLNWCVENPVAAMTLGSALLGGAGYVAKRVVGNVKEHTTLQATCSSYSKTSHFKSSGKIKTGYFTSRQRNNYLKGIAEGLSPFEAMDRSGIKYKL